MCDYPLDELNGKTPLEYADNPNMDRLAKLGRCGLTNNVFDHFAPGSDVANMSIFGFNPDKYYTGRGPLEAGNMGIDTTDRDVIFRCNTIYEENGLLDDFNANHITTEESTVLLNDLNKFFQEKYPDFKGKFYPGVSYRHVFVYSCDNEDEVKEMCDFDTSAPHDIVGEKIDDYTTWNNKSAQYIKKIMTESEEFLKNHEINRKRAENNLKPANMVWLWSQGVTPKLDDFTEMYHLKGAVITAVDLLKGIANLGGMDIINVPGATGYFDTDYEAKGRYAIDNLDKYDVLFIHIEAPDEAGHAQNVKEKVKAIESIDKYILGPVWQALDEKYDDYKLVVLPDHPTPIPVGTHTRDDIPQAIYSPSREPDDVDEYTEAKIAKGSVKKEEGYKLLSRLINDDY